MQVEDHTLVIKGKRFRREPGSCKPVERKKNNCEGEQTNQVVELKYYLALKLSDRIDKDNIGADCCGDGLLAVSIPYKEKYVRDVYVAS